MARLIVVTVIIAFQVIGMVGCDGENNGVLPDDPVPTVHMFPSWIGTETVTFENRGAIAVGPGWVTIMDSAVGVVLYNVISECYEMAVPHGISPASSIGVASCLCLRDGVFGPLVVFREGGYALLDENERWNGRSDLALSSDGAIAVWRSFAGDHAAGIWGVPVVGGTYRYVGNGSFPTWKPGASTLLYRGDGAGTFLIEYNWTTGERDTLLDFAEGVSGQWMSYSPGCDRIAYFRLSVVRGYSGLCIYDIESGAETQMNEHVGRGLSWGAAGIVYSNGCGDYEDEGCGVLWHLNPETGVARQLTSRLQFVFPDSGHVNCSSGK